MRETIKYSITIKMSMSKRHEEDNCVLENNNKTNIDITFKDMTYEVNVTRKKEKRLILKSISGKFNAGELTAIMGPSGAGKSSLMNILTGFITHGVGGSINFGNDNNNNKTARNSCCYIMQDNNLCGLFTLNEYMMFAVNLKIDNKCLNLKEKRMLVNDILRTLKLNTACKTRCDRLSGGQKKRLLIALELINDPAILFLDEPTTGLDSSSCDDLIYLLRKLTTEGRTIICTIHQPSAYVYEMFHQIYVLAQGHCVYQGTPQKTVQYLHSVNLHCPVYHNPADFLLECVNGDYGDYIEKLMIAANKPEWLYIKHCSLDIDDAIHDNNIMCNYDTHIYPPSEWTRFLMLINRGCVQIVRDWSITYVKLAVYILIAILFGLMYGDSGTNGSKQLSNVGLFVIHCIFLWYTNAVPAVLRYPNEILLIKKETFNNWYRLRTYYMASFIISMPFNIISSLTYMMVVYLMTHQLLEFDRIIRVLISCSILTLCAESSGLFLGTIFQPVNGVFFAAILTSFLFMYSGFVSLLSEMPKLMRAVSYLSPMRYTFENFIIAIYGNNRSDTVCPENIIYCHLKKPTMILKTFGMEKDNYRLNICLLLLQLIIYKVAAYFLLKKRLRRLD